MRYVNLIAIAIVLSACETEKINQCSNDSDCADIAFPFCDVDGQYMPSAGEHNICTITPSDCPAARCGCQAGATTCSGDVLTTCDSGGASVKTETCPLGCIGNRCATFQPMNGLEAALELSTSGSLVTIPDGSSINTTTGMVLDSSNTIVPVPSQEVEQPGNPSIRVFYGTSFDMGSVNVVGDDALAIVADGPVTIHGTLVANGNTFGPGSVRTNIPCQGHDGVVGGGGANYTNGGEGNSFNFSTSVSATAEGGLSRTSYSPLLGGVVVAMQMAAQDRRV